MILTLSFGGAKRICSLTVTSGLLLFNLNCGEMKETRSFGHYHCTEVGKGEINYSELLVFPQSLGNFWMHRTLRRPLYCTGVAIEAAKHRHFSAILAILSLF